MFLGVGWGGVGWGNNVHVLTHSHDVTPRHVHLHMRTYVMLRWRSVTSRRGGVTFTYVRAPMMLRDLIAFCECILDRKEQWFAQMAQSATLDWKQADTFCLLTSQKPICQKDLQTCWKNLLGSYWHHRLVLAYDQSQCSRSVDILPRKRTKIEWPHLDVRTHMAVAMGGKCSWKSPVGENRCVLSEGVEITGKNGCRWGFGHADFPKGTFFLALRHVNYIQ